jgi:hypothetical protein
MEKIISINEDGFFIGKKGYDGFNIITSEQTIKIGVSNYSSCCENWGYFISNDEFTDFIGASLINIELVDECLNIKKVADYYDGEAMFVNLITDKGILQFTVYNAHNGYYAHKSIIISKQLNLEGYL